MYTASREIAAALLTAYIAPAVTEEDLGRFTADLGAMRAACGRFSLCFVLARAPSGAGCPGWASLLRPEHYGEHLDRVAVVSDDALKPAVGVLAAAVRPTVRHFCTGSWACARAWLLPEGRALAAPGAAGG